jgi:hypothetical protein
MTADGSSSPFGRAAHETIGSAKVQKKAAHDGIACDTMSSSEARTPATGTERSTSSAPSMPSYNKAGPTTSEHGHTRAGKRRERGTYPQEQTRSQSFLGTLFKKKSKRHRDRRANKGHYIAGV